MSRRLKSTKPQPLCERCHERKAAFLVVSSWGITYSLCRREFTDFFHRGDVAGFEPIAPQKLS